MKGRPSQRKAKGELDIVGGTSSVKCKAARILQLPFRAWIDDKRAGRAGSGRLANAPWANPPPPWTHVRFSSAKRDGFRESLLVGSGCCGGQRVADITLVAEDDLLCRAGYQYGTCRTTPHCCSRTMLGHAQARAVGSRTRPSSVRINHHAKSCTRHR